MIDGSIELTQAVSSDLSSESETLKQPGISACMHERSKVSELATKLIA